MQTYFYDLATYLSKQLSLDESHLCNFSGENSDFIRFNQARVRQAGSVNQHYFTLNLVRENKERELRHAAGKVTLSGDAETDKARLKTLLNSLRDRISYLPPDPHFLYAKQKQNSEQRARNQLPAATEVVAEILETAQGTDFVGFYAGGGMFTGFANSLGQRNWHESYSFNLDWSLYQEQDKAVKSAYSETIWESSEFQRKFQQARENLEILKRPARVLEPGKYRAYLAPAALKEIMDLLSENSFGLKAVRAKQSCLLPIIEKGERFSSQVTLRENTSGGISPDFQAQGFRKPEEVTLISQGVLYDTLVSPRSAKEYGFLINGANDSETPESLEMASGRLPKQALLKHLGTGLYVNNLWYANYSDRAAGRITGMTRFATFWVEKGEIAAPIKAMRFDEVLFELLGKNLETLTEEREFIADTTTYEQRSMSSVRLPGALVKSFNLTL